VAPTTSFFFPYTTLFRSHLECRRGRLEAAEAAFVEAARRAPASVEAHYNVGFVRHELGRSAEALASLEQARALAPSNEQVFYQRSEEHTSELQSLTTLLF